MKKYRPTFAEQDKELERKINERFTTKLLSNSKWKKLIDAIVGNISSFKRIEFKKVVDERIGILNIDESTEYGFDYWNNGFEGHNSLGGWLLFKEIEYLRFPARFNVNTPILEQDLFEIKKLINSIGAFELIDDDDSLSLLCYK